MRILLLLFIVVPVIELALLIEVGGFIGTMNTILLIVLTGIVGASLAHRQGLGIMMRVQDQLQRGELPAGALVDGAIVLVAGALLMTPGILTDAVGFLCLIPASRNFVKTYLIRRFEKGIREGSIHVVSTGDFSETSRSDDVYDIKAEEVPRDRIDHPDDD